MVYAPLRGNIGLKSQVSCNIPRQVAGTYKTIVELTKIEMNYWQKITSSPTSMKLSYKRYYTITDDSVSITTFSNVEPHIKYLTILMQSNSFVLLGNLKLLKSWR